MPSEPFYRPSAIAEREQFSFTLPGDDPYLYRAREEIAPGKRLCDLEPAQQHEVLDRAQRYKMAAKTQGQGGGR